MDREQKVIFAAGVIDSGSYIGIQEFERDKWMTLLRIRRSELLVIDKIREVFPGGYYGIKDGKCWISYQGKRVSEILKEVYPYLVAKRKHAEVIFELRESVDRAKKLKRKPGNLLDENERVFRQGCKERIQLLNSREIIDTSPDIPQGRYEIKLPSTKGGKIMTSVTPSEVVFMCRSCGKNEVNLPDDECLWCQFSDATP